MSECRINLTPHTEQMAEYPGLRCDIFCPTAGGVDSSFNYYTTACAERLAGDYCEEITCKRHNRYDPDGLKAKDVVQKKNREKYAK